MNQRVKYSKRERISTQERIKKKKKKKQYRISIIRISIRDFIDKHRRPRNRNFLSPILLRGSRLDLEPESILGGHRESFLVQFHRYGGFGAGNEVASREQVEQQNLRLQHRESIPYAHPGSHPEREEQARIDHLFRVVQEPVRVELVRFRVKLGIALNPVDREPHVVTLFEEVRFLARPVGRQFERFRANPVGGHHDRIHSKSLVNDRVEELHLVNSPVRHLAIPILQNLVDLVLQSPLDVVVHGNLVSGEAHQRGGALETAEEEDERLGAYVYHAHLPSRAQFSLRFHHQLDHVRPHYPLLLPRLDRLAHQIDEEIRDLFLDQPDPEQGAHAYGQHPRYEELDGRPRSESGPLPPVHVELVLPVLHRVHLDAERASGYHVVRVSGERVFQLDGALVPGQRGEIITVFLRAIAHQYEHRLHLARGERGAQQVSYLSPPVPAKGEQVLGEQGIGRLVLERSVIRELFEMLDGDRLDQFRVPDHEHGGGCVVHTQVLHVRIRVVDLPRYVGEIVPLDHRLPKTSQQWHRAVIRNADSLEIFVLPDQLVIGYHEDGDYRRGYRPRIEHRLC